MQGVFPGSIDCQVNNEMNKPYSESCDQNKDVILSVISPLFSALSNVLEIGSGTGQHAVYFAEKMPQLTWHTSDCQSYLDGINAWRRDAGLTNIKPPFELDVSKSQWPVSDIDAIFTANSVHIMQQQDVVNLINGAGELLTQGGSFVIYGPFNYNGQYTSKSNENFDQWLKQRDPLSGIKHFEEIESLANANGMRLVTDYEMPANNRILHFIKV
jgi:cyclopropane fatty-acyl-phospholipid synthase-like methyltransferase